MNKVITMLCFISINCPFALSSPEPSLLQKASHWEKVVIPEAKCGRGHDYTVFIRRHSTEKLLVEFMGGGACWNKRTCVTLPTTWVYPMIELSQFSILTSETNETNPFKDHSNIYFPFCTGDVFTGNRISNYDGTKIYHYGYRNIVLALKHLKEKNIIAFDQVKDLIVWGASAGGIGALTHANRVASYIPETAKKTLIADSPGLHFGPTFWEKFDKDAQKDFKTAFNGVQLDVDFNDGFVARKMGPVLDYYKDWNVGFLYSVRDWTMSWFFGEISKKDHEALLLGPEGLPAIARGHANVHVWLNQSDEHRFLLKEKTSLMSSDSGQTAIDFAGEVYSY
ncbi:MAG: hypothetical protein JNM24_19560 [Bdellovibrionaceae bacterium]|nr:hypothetical protein [Pseudobdellovibrionaceae bacterium]